MVITSSNSRHLHVRVASVSTQAEGIKSFVLIDANGCSMPPFSAGSHVVVYLPNGLTRQYSLCNDPAERDRYQIAVLREPNSRGGSMFMHHQVAAGSMLSISPPRNNFQLVDDAESFLLIAGGIGITPILSMCRDLHRRRATFRLHYCARSLAMTAFHREILASDFAPFVTFHHDGGDVSKGLDVRTLLAAVPYGVHVYCCGPRGLIETVERATTHWPSGRVHFEHFSATGDLATTMHAGGQPFEVVVASTGQSMMVPPERTILEVLRDHGIFVDNVCKGGFCGTCITKVLEGVPDHRDLVLDETEKAENKLIAVCCSRARSARLVLDL